MHSSMMSLEGHAALSAYPDYKQKSAQLLKDTIDSVDGPKQQAMLGEALTNIQDNYWKIWAGHAAGQEKTYQNRVASDAIASNSARASNLLVAGDERGAERALREQDMEVHNFFEGHGYDQDASEVEAQKRRGITLKTAIETVAAGGDVGKAQSLFDKYRDRMDPTSVLQVTANLKSGKAQLDGRNLADEESGHSAPKADTVAGVPSSYIEQVKRSEGFAPQAKWDVKQFSSGYGTKANFEGEVISKEEADRRFDVEFAKAGKIVDSVNPNLDPGTKAALTSLTYNAGSDWTHAGLGEKIRAGDIDGARQLFLQYNKAGGETNEGLANRRYREAQWFGSSEAPASNGPLVDKQTAYERVLARTDNNPLLQTAAIARLNQVYGIYHAEQAAQHATFDQKLADTQAEAMATGTAQAPLLEPDFVNRYGATEGQRQYGEYQKNLALGSDIAGLSTMSPDEQKPGAGAAYAGSRQSGLRGRADPAAGGRQSDPALQQRARRRSGGVCAAPAAGGAIGLCRFQQGGRRQGRHASRKDRRSRPICQCHTGRAGARRRAAATARDPDRQPGCQYRRCHQCSGDVG
jgi:GH24 family phage-related lysozyme (muramidase)